MQMLNQFAVVSLQHCALARLQVFAYTTMFSTCHKVGIVSISRPHVFDVLSALRFKDVYFKAKD